MKIARREGMAAIGIIALCLAAAFGLFQPREAAAAVNTLLHNSDRFGVCTLTDYNGTSAATCTTAGGTWTPATGKWAAGWGVTGGQYGAFDCTTCHTPRATNIKGINGAVTAPSGTFPGSTVVFRNTQTPGVYNFGDDSDSHTSSTKICEVCHSKTLHHDYNSSGSNTWKDLTVHNDGADCTACHTHQKGFYGGACNSCHGNPPVAATIGGPNGLASPATGATLSGGTTYAGAHGRHAVSLDTHMKCETCHYNSKMPNLYTAIFMGFQVNNTNMSGNWSSVTVSAGTLTVLNTLSNGYTWTWPSGGQTTVNQAVGGRTTCSLYCHGNALTGGTTTAPSWIGGSTQAACGTCHGGSAWTSASSNPPTAGSHTKHASSTLYAFPCNDCHSTSPQTGAHVNGNVAWGFNTADVRINAAATYKGAFSGATGTLAGGAAYGNCSSLYCHSNGKAGTSAVYALVTWGSGTLACNACHGTTNSMGYPDYANGGQAAATANSHQGHVATMGYMCQTCHLQTTTTGTSIRPDIVPSLHVNGNTQNVAFDTIAQPLGSYNTGAKQCSNISCHASTNPIWGQTLGCDGCHGFPPATGAHLAHIESAGLLAGITGYGTPVAAWYGDASNATNYALGCGNCHPGSNASHMTSTASLTVSMYEAGAPGGSLKSRNATTAAYSNLFSGTGKCSAVYCHGSGSKTATSVASAVSPSWNSNADAYALSNGLAGRCGICHGNPPQYASAGTGTVGSNSHYNATAFMGKEGGHGVTIHFDNVYNRVTGTGLLTRNSTTESSHGNSGSSTTMLCSVCHAATASSITPDTYSMNTSTLFRCTGCHNNTTPTKTTSGAIADKAKHVNGQADVAFASINFKSKAQLRNVPTTTQWTRMIGYNSAGAYDQTTSALNSGSYNTTTKTCTTDCHMSNAATWGDTTVTCNSCHTTLP
jgi:predicted CxxxxCH...CXXCH cytochrome family protein